MARGEAYSEKEDVCIVRAYLEISEDPAAGSDQKRKVFHQRAHEKFLEAMAKDGEPSTRSSEAIRHRYADIKRECQKFQSVFQLVFTAPITGNPSQDDRVVIATILYSNEDKGQAAMAAAAKRVLEDPTKAPKPFEFLKCWQELKSSRVLSDSAQLSDSSSDLESLPSCSVDTPAEFLRPMGRKKAKLLARAEPDPLLEYVGKLVEQSNGFSKAREKDLEIKSAHLELEKEKYKASLAMEKELFALRVMEAQNERFRLEMQAVQLGLLPAPRPGYAPAGPPNGLASQLGSAAPTSGLGGNPSAEPAQ